jgi:hypothetical protein
MFVKLAHLNRNNIAPAGGDDERAVMIGNIEVAKDAFGKA